MREPNAPLPTPQDVADALVRAQGVLGTAELARRLRVANSVLSRLTDADRTAFDEDRTLAPRVAAWIRTSLAEIGAPIPPGEIATTPDEAEAIASRIVEPLTAWCIPGKLPRDAAGARHEADRHPARLRAAASARTPAAHRQPRPI